MALQMGLKIHVSLLSRFMYITSLSVDSGSEYFNRCWQTKIVVLHPQPENSKVPKWTHYMAIKQAFEYKTKGIYLQRQPKQKGFICLQVK